VGPGVVVEQDALINMRTFIAIELPQEIKNRLAQLQTLLKKSGADVKWVKPDNIHLTLKFLGEISEETLPKIIKIIESATLGKKQFEISLSSLGTFPEGKTPRVIWIGVNKGDQEIKNIAETLEENILAGLDIPKENRPFSSHITIGRVKSNLNMGRLTKDLKEFEGYFGKETIEFKTSGITLFKSSLGPSGPSYEPLKVVNLTTT
jgi:2'-5' RNA ligase